MIDAHTEAKIVRLFGGEKMTIGAIAKAVGVHHTTVRRVLRQAGAISKTPVRVGSRPSMVDPYIPTMVETLEKYPTITATRLHAMLKERGYQGGISHFRRIVREFRPQPVSEAFLRLRTVPGEQAQVDWASFGKVEIGRARRQLSAFVMVLSHSRKPFLRFFYDQRMGSFLSGHVEAFRAFGGVPRVILYDNLKSAVLERHGDAIRFHPELLSLSAHYCFEPRPVGVRRANEKGRVERAIRYVRSSFFVAREYTDLADLNAQADEWCATTAVARQCPGDRDLTVELAFDLEREFLRDLPNDEYPCEDVATVQVGKTPYVRFDRNDYSVPHTLVRRRLVVRANRSHVRIIDGQETVAMHLRSYDKGDCIEDESHIEDLVAYKSQAKEHRATDRLVQAVPNARNLLARVASRGDNLGSAVAALMRMLKSHGAVALSGAVDEALTSDAFHPNTVRRILERDEPKPPLVPVDLPDDPRVRDLVVRPHALGQYDTIGELGDEEVSDGH